MTDNIILPYNSKAILLTQDKFAIVDAEDYDWLAQWKWHYSLGYAQRTVVLGYSNGRRLKKTIHMHRLINETPDEMQCDHINRNSLDNRRCNLRSCTHGENSRNSMPQKSTNHSKYKGVVFRPDRPRAWKAHIRINKKHIGLGCFFTQEEAALAYNKGAKLYHGEFACLNIIQE